jgi:hypothetical protein
MITHQAPAMYQQSFCLLAIGQAVDYNITVRFPGKNVHPFHYGKTQEVNLRLVPNLIATIVHAVLKYIRELLSACVKHHQMVVFFFV